MASSSKYLKLNQNVLLQWVYDSENLKAEEYQVVNNLNESKRGYMSKIGLNRVENTLFTIDPVVKKYAKVDANKYNYLKLESYATSYTQFDKLRIHLPTSYDFGASGYIGLYVRVYTYDYTNKNVVDFASYLYDDTDSTTATDLILNEEFLYDEQVWGKYLTFDIPSIDAVSKQRSSTVSTNTPIPNSINANLSNGNGISEESPIFIEFSFVLGREYILGNTYYYMSDIFTKSIAKVPEYMDLSANIEQATDGDYFWIYGSYGGSNESMDNFINEMYAKGRQCKIEYEVTLFEENILMNSQTFSVTENFTKKMWYRPILSFTNTTASLDVSMRIIDLVDNSKIERFASLSMTTEVFKYGKKLTRINLDNAWKPKIYNFKPSNGTSMVQNTDSLSSKILLSKVNYPVLTDRINILVGATPTTVSSYKPMGLAQLIINPFGNVVTFNIASAIDTNGNATPFNLTKITENATVTLSFKNDTDFLEKDLWRETDKIDFENGVVVYKIDQSDISTLKRIGQNNKSFYLTIKTNNGMRSLLYSGQWLLFEDMKFVDRGNITTGSNTTTTNTGDFVDNVTITTPRDIFPELPGFVPTWSDGATVDNVIDSPYIRKPATQTNPNSNLLVFLKADADIKSFDDYLLTIGANVWLRKPGGNSTCLTYLYLLLNVSPAVIEDIKLQKAVLEVVPMAFCLGSNATNTNVNTTQNNITNIQNRLKDFNCATAEKLRQQSIDFSSNFSNPNAPNSNQQTF